MKNLLILLLLASNLGYAQSPFLRVYCNNVLVTNNETSGYFLPVEFKFEFEDSTKGYRIKEGTIQYYGYAFRVFQIDNNYIYTSNPSVGDSVLITITKLEFNNGKRRSIDTLFVRTIKCYRELKPSITEKKAINNNPLLIHIKDKLFDPNEGIPNEPGEKWTISLDKAARGKEIIKSEVILVRGKRPIRTFTYTNNELDLSIFFTKGVQPSSNSYPGDFLLLRAYTDNSNSLPKIIEVK